MGNCCTKKVNKPETRTIYPSTTLHLDENEQPYNPNAQYANNKIRTTKYSIWTFLPLNLWEQFHRVANIYFVFILILNFMPGINAFAKEVAPIPVVLTFAVVAIKDAYEDFRRHLSDRRVNRKLCKVFCSEKGVYVDEIWENILPGDFLRLHTNEMIPADILLLHSSNIAGICHIETANLDGESNLKQREVVERTISRSSFSPLHFTFPAEVEAPSSELYKFSGKIVRPNDIIPIRKNNMILRGCVLRNTDYVEGMVLYAGRETKSALNNAGPRFKRSKLERRINMDVIWCVLILAAICFTGAVGCGVWQENLPGEDVLFVALDRNVSTSSPAFQGFLNFWRFIVIFQSIIPLPLYVSIEFIKMHQVWHMNQDLQLYDPRVDRRIEVRAFNILEDLGQVEYVFCDKTGTLTENKMEFKRASISGREYITDAMNGCDPDQPYPTQERSHGNLIGSFGPGTVSTFDSLRDVVNRMSLVAVTHRETKPQLPLMTPVEQPTIECGTSRTHLPHSSFDINEEQCIQDFILALTICNTAVVSATKNTATLFQLPAPRKGLRQMLRPHTSERSKRRKERRAARSEASSIKHTLSLGSLFSRKRRPLKSELNSIPRFQVHDEREEASDIQTLDVTSVNALQASTPLVPERICSGDGGSTDVDEPGRTGPQITIVEEVAETNEDLPVKERTDSFQHLPPVVPGLVLDLPTPHVLHHHKAGPMHKCATTTAGVRWRTSDLADSADSTNEQDSDVNSTISLDSPMTARQPVSTAENETVSTDQGECSSSRPVSMRTLTVVAHDGLSYELPVAKDFVHNRSDTNSCPLSDELLLNSYESESPDELSLVKAACRQGCKLLQRGLDFVLIWLPTDGLVGVRVLHILPFDSVRKRMSILIRHPATDEAVLYTKGADSAIFHRVHCANEEEAKRLELTRAHVEEFSRVGLRTLVLVKRIVPEEELKIWSREYVIAEATASDSSNALRALMDRIERNFTLLGATGIEDRLQPGVPETIGHLREAGIHVWVLTGDKQETAVNVAHSARLITKEHQLIYINASSKLKTGYLINRHLHSLVCGHPWADCAEINDVMSDDPDVESSSTSTSESESDQAMDPTIVAAYANQRHVRVCPPEGNLSDNHSSCVLPPAWTRFTRRSRHRITRSLSESRAVTQKRRRRRPRLIRRRRTHLFRERPIQRRSQASLESAKLALVIDGETLQFALEEDMKARFLRLARLCTSVLCCRSTPSQKAAVVGLVKDGLHVLTLAVGDGANDVNMIQVANVGVGLGGEEGMQAVMASDFAISRFRFLQRLILVHGHLCYDKLAHTALYLFYKDAVYIFLLFWFQLFNGFSGSNAIDQLSQILFNVTMTSLPPFLMGIWDNPIDADTLLANPVLYRSGIEGKAYRPWLFWINILDAIWQTLIIFFVPYLFYADSSMTLWSFGVLQMNLLLLCSLLHAALETRTWVYLHWIGLLLSYLVFYIVFTMIYHSLAVTGISPESPYRVIFVTMHDATFWLLTPVTVIAALLPRLLFIALNNTLAPTLDTVASLLSRVYGCGQRLPLTPYLSGKLDISAPIESISSGLSHFTPPSATERSGRPISASSRSSLPSVEVEPVEAPARLMARVEQLLSVSSRLFRGAASSTTAAASTISHRRSLTAPISPLSMENLRHQHHGIAVDLRHRMYNRRRSRTRTLSYGAGRLEQASTAIPLSRNSNNFDDAAGLPSTPVIWPVVDPRTRAHSLTMRRYPERRIRPMVDDSTFRDQASSLPMDRSLYMPTSQAADPSHGVRRTQGDVELRVGRLAPQVDPPPPYRLSECSASETENQKV